MNILVTGAAGFIGAALVERLRQDPAVHLLTLVDLQATPDPDPRIRVIAGSIADPAILAQAVDPAPDLVFHLASIPGGRAEADPPLARAINLRATETLLDLLRDRAPRLVFASSVAALGGPLPERIDDDTPPAPQLSYGAQKLIGEILIADHSRRGWLDGRSVRLCGIVTRPPQATGAISIFFSDLIRDLPAGRRVTVPMRPGATTWLMSLPTCIDALLTAASLDPATSPRRVWTPPPVTTSMADLVAGIGARLDRDVAPLVDYRPNPAIEDAFGTHRPLVAAAADRAGMAGDGTLAALIDRASVLRPAPGPPA